MDKLEVNGETWGRVMMGKQGDTPMYRQLIDGKMTPVKKALVPRDVIEAFEGVAMSEPIPEEVKRVADIIGDENIGGESIKIDSTSPNDDFGFSGEAP